MISLLLEHIVILFLLVSIPDKPPLADTPFVQSFTECNMYVCMNVCMNVCI